MKLYKSKLLTAAFSIVTLAACQNNTDKTNEPSGAAGDQLQTLTSDTVGVTKHYLNKDSANRMINSYITSINGNPSDSNLYSWIISAGALRYYLNENPSIKNIKIMLAHTQEYINSGHYGQYAGYKNNALTVIIAGYDSSNNYVFIGGDLVLDNMSPCPNLCPPNGDAAQNTFPIPGPGSSR